MNKKVAIIIALAVVGVFAAVVVFHSDTTETEFAFSVFRRTSRGGNDKNLTKLFQQWKKKHNKTYGGVEHKKRYQIFVQNLKRIEKINSKNRTFTVGLNKFSDLTKQEFSSIYLGLKPRKNITKRPFIVNPNFTAPASVDWRTSNAVTAIKDQGQCGSCWAFSTTGSLEGLNAIKNGNLLSFSEQQLVDCSTENEGCNGGLMTLALEYTASNGITLEDSYPYTGEDGTCTYDSSQKAFANTAYTTPNSNADLLTAAAQGPVSVSVEADQDVFQYYTSGVLNDDTCGTDLDHGVLVVGYDTDATSGPYWIVKNSWGADWGNNGFLWIARVDGDGICGINLDNALPTL